MKLEKVVTVFNWRILFMLVLGNLSVSMGFASTSSSKTEEVEMGGNWTGTQLSLNPDISITAFISGSFMSIQNTEPYCDIIIDIINNKGEVVLQEKVATENSGCIVLPIEHLPTGSYTLELRNLYGSYLYGSFYKN